MTNQHSTANRPPTQITRRRALLGLALAPALLLPRPPEPDPAPIEPLTEIQFLQVVIPWLEGQLAKARQRLAELTA